MCELEGGTVRQRSASRLAEMVVLSEQRCRLIGFSHPSQSLHALVGSLDTL